MQSTISRQWFDAIKPDGAAFNEAKGGSMDKLHEGLSDNMQTVMDFMSGLANIRDPWTTPVLSDLELEYGITPNSSLSDAWRRARLAQKKFQRSGRGTKNDMQKALDASGFGTGGFGLIVVENPWPNAVNPAAFLVQGWHDSCGQATSVCGYNLGGPVLAGCRHNGGELVVNGAIFDGRPRYHGCAVGPFDIQCDPFNTAPNMAGYFTEMILIPKSYTVPADPQYWPLVFFIARSVTYTGPIISDMGFASIPETRKQDLHEIILHIKPVRTWCGLMVNWV